MTTRTREITIAAPDGTTVSVHATICPASRRLAASSVQRPRYQRRTAARWLARESGRSDVRREER